MFKFVVAASLLISSPLAFGAANMIKGEMKKTVIPKNVASPQERQTYGEFNFGKKTVKTEPKKVTRAPAAKPPVKIERTSYGEFSTPKANAPEKKVVTKKTVSTKTTVKTTESTKQ